MEVKRLFDICFSLTALLLTAPLIVVMAVLIKIGSKGPVFYLAQRAGKEGKPFLLIKLRTMKRRTMDVRQSSITAVHDARVFPLGRVLRHAKLDELPQFVNVLIGDMSVVGPRPEDVDIAAQFDEVQKQTLNVRPGLVSPGSLFNYTHGRSYLVAGDAENAYIRSLLPVKLALERIYIDRMGFWYDLELIFRTVKVVTLALLGKRRFPLPEEYYAAQRAGYIGK